MTEHAIFYYPYASFVDTQAPLLKAAALYFDKLYILDPLKASSGTIGPGAVEHDVCLLEDAGILVRITPEDVLSKYESAMAEAIRADLGDAEFRRLCETSARGDVWTIALAKIPEEIRQEPEFQPIDRSMQRTLGDLPRSLSSELAGYDEAMGHYAEYAESTEVYDEYREDTRGIVEYRYADYPVAIGEAIMVNHALFGGILHTGATPLTDDPFHQSVLSRKLERTQQLPEVRSMLDQRAEQRHLKRDQLAMTALTDVDLAIISPDVPLSEILEYRTANEAALGRARDRIGSLAWEIRETPWSKEFGDTVEFETLPTIRKELSECAKARDAWLKDKKGKKVLALVGLTASAAGALISLLLSPTPLMPVALATGSLAFVKDVVVPGGDLALDWKEGKKKAGENGLHYLLKFKN